MSQEKVEMVRKPLRVRQRSRRTLDQRILLRFPLLNNASARLIERLRPRSRLRQMLVWRSGQLAAEAFNRRDLDAFLLTYQADYELRPAREWVDAGLAKPSYRGGAGLREYVSDWSDVWGGDLYIEPLELIDLGDRVVILARQPSRAQASGVAITANFATVATVEHGKVIRQQDFLDHSQALEAVGLRE